ncbi:MAG TPA: hypothetical protein VNS12_13625 [Pelagibacterium sp.]|uniref:hypothetical protein n=1 Tax=Pelagibacterium sp. TaxID=1967288 RepID=UPI002CE574A3|nr:hypothetical protein [Pelagibacterium sp.]HWJ89102.1 hypothetical protein [Pelagibacterium sp.]
MMAVLRGFPAEGIVACFDEAPGGGDWRDINAPRNAPAKNPGAHLSAVHWHSEFFQYELAMPIQTVTVSHAALAGRSIYWGYNLVYDGNNPVSTIGYLVPGQVATASHTLVSHGLGYVPLAFVAYGGRMLMPGVAVQTASDGRSRFVSPYITSGVVGLREVYNSSSSGLGAVSRTYQVMVFRVPVEDALLPLFGGGGGEAVVGRGKVRTSRTYARHAGGGATPFNIDRGRTVDLNNGRVRIATGGTVTTEAGYGGAFTAPPFVPVGV